MTTEIEYVGDGCHVHLPSGAVTVERGEVLEMDTADLAAVAGNPEWVPVKTKPVTKATDKKEVDQ